MKVDVDGLSKSVYSGKQETYLRILRKYALCVLL